MTKIPKQRNIRNPLLKFSRFLYIFFFPNFFLSEISERRKFLWFCYALLRISFPQSKKIFRRRCCQPRINKIKEPLLVMKENVLYILKKFITFLSIIRLKIIIQQEFFKLHKKLLSNPILDNISWQRSFASPGQFFQTNNNFHHFIARYFPAFKLYYPYFQGALSPLL